MKGRRSYSWHVLEYLIKSLLNHVCTHSQQLLSGFQPNFMGTFNIREVAYIAGMLWSDEALELWPLKKIMYFYCPCKFSATTDQIKTKLHGSLQ